MPHFHLVERGHKIVGKNGKDTGKRVQDKRNINLYEMQILTVIEGVVEPSLKDERLLGYLGGVTPKELVKKLFLAGEITELSNIKM